jgi:hypothetical protein
MAKCRRYYNPGDICYLSCRREHWRSSQNLQCRRLGCRVEPTSFLSRHLYPFSPHFYFLTAYSRYFSSFSLPILAISPLLFLTASLRAAAVGFRLHDGGGSGGNRTVPSALVCEGVLAVYPACATCIVIPLACHNSSALSLANTNAPSSS